MRLFPAQVLRETSSHVALAPLKGWSAVFDFCLPRPDCWLYLRSNILGSVARKAVTKLVGHLNRPNLSHAAHILIDAAEPCLECMPKVWTAQGVS